MASNNYTRAGYNIYTTKITLAIIKLPNTNAFARLTQVYNLRKNNSNICHLIINSYKYIYKCILYYLITTIKFNYTQNPTRQV